MVRWLRMWGPRRRLDRITRDAGWPPKARGIFTGNVRVKRRRFADWYVREYKDPR